MTSDAAVHTATENIEPSPAHDCLIDRLIGKRWNWTCIGKVSFGENRSVFSLATSDTFRGATEIGGAPLLPFNIENCWPVMLAVADKLRITHLMM